MHCAFFAIFAAFIVPCFVECVPFSPQGGQLQRNRRRAIDYPLPKADIKIETQSSRRRKRSPYNVVQVDGSSSINTPVTPVDIANSSPTTRTVVQTVTQSVTPSVSKEIVEITSIIEQSQSPVTVVITTTVQHEVTAAVSEMTVSPSPMPQAVVEAGGLQTTVIKTVTASPSPTTTQYYDDGMWHTSYSVKTFSTSSTSVSWAPPHLLDHSVLDASNSTAPTLASAQPTSYRQKHPSLSSTAVQVGNSRWNGTKTDSHAIKRRRTE